MSRDLLRHNDGPDLLTDGEIMETWVFGAAHLSALAGTFYASIQAVNHMDQKPKVRPLFLHTTGLAASLCFATLMSVTLVHRLVMKETWADPFVSRIDRRTKLFVGDLERYRGVGLLGVMVGSNIVMVRRCGIKGALPRVVGGASLGLLASVPFTAISLDSCDVRRRLQLLETSVASGTLASRPSMPQGRSASPVSAQGRGTVFEAVRDQSSSSKTTNSDPASDDWPGFDWQRPLVVLITTTILFVWQLPR